MLNWVINLEKRKKKRFAWKVKTRDVKDIGRFKTGDFGLTIKNLNDFEETK